MDARTLAEMAVKFSDARAAAEIPAVRDEVARRYARPDTRAARAFVAAVDAELARLRLDAVAASTAALYEKAAACRAAGFQETETGWADAWGTDLTQMGRGYESFSAATESLYEKLS